MSSRRGIPPCAPSAARLTCTQDPDALDTWFSTALWPFSTLGWPDDTTDDAQILLPHHHPRHRLRYHHLLGRPHDLLAAWSTPVKKPFDTVLIHGLVRDAQGRKMSKSLGNGVDPLEVIDQYGADALRFSAGAPATAPATIPAISTTKLESARNFANKVWNATRFIQMNLSDEITRIELPETLATEDKWVLTLYNDLVKEVTDNLEKFELGVASAKLYDFIWDILCDWYIELVKSRLQAGGETALNAQKVLVYVMANTLKLLHPFMPFITEEIWQSLPHEGEAEAIMISQWPAWSEELSFQKEEVDFQKIIDIIRAIRNQRTEMNIPPSKKAKVYIETAEAEIFTNGIPFLQRLASASEVEVGEKFELPGAVQIITHAARALIPMDELIDREKELARLEKEREKCQSDIDFIGRKLDNPGFVAKAPAQLIETERAKLAQHKERMAKILESIAAMRQ